MSRRVPIADVVSDMVDALIINLARRHDNLEALTVEAASEPGVSDLLVQACDLIDGTLSHLDDVAARFRLQAQQKGEGKGS